MRQMIDVNDSPTSTPPQITPHHTHNTYIMLRLFSRSPARLSLHSHFQSLAICKIVKMPMSTHVVPPVRHSSLSTTTNWVPRTS